MAEYIAIPKLGMQMTEAMVPADETAPVARVVGLIAENETELEKIRKEPPGEIYTSEAGATAAQAEGAPTTPEAEKAGVQAAPAERKRVRISPVARKMAEEHMIDVTAITGTGPEGRIIREDIQKAISQTICTAVSPFPPN